MKTKSALTLVLFFLVLLSFGQQAKMPSFKLKGKKLLSIFNTYDILTGDITINGTSKVVSIKFSGSKIGGAPTIITEIEDRKVLFTYTNNAGDPTLDLTNPYKCSTDHTDFIIKPNKTYYLIPSRIRNADDGKYYISYRIKKQKSQSASYYKAINPIPPGGTVAF
jgi:hypothetical protein